MTPSPHQSVPDVVRLPTPQRVAALLAPLSVAGGDACWRWTPLAQSCRASGQCRTRAPSDLRSLLAQDAGDARAGRRAVVHATDFQQPTVAHPGERDFTFR